MAADLQLWHPTYLADAKGKLSHRYVNLLNAPITALELLFSGDEIPDVYEFVFTNTGGTITATVEPLVHTTRNPYKDMAGIAIVADGVTWNVYAGFRFKVDALVDTGWKARIAIWNYLEDDGTYTTFFAYGTIQANQASTGQRVAVKNVGDADAEDCTLYVLPGVSCSGSGHDEIIAEISNHTNPTRHKLAVSGAYAMTFANWTNAGAYYTADVYIDAVKAIEDAKFDGATYYEYGSSPNIGYDDGADLLQGLRVRFAALTVDPTGNTLTVTVNTEADDWEQFATDVSGSPGTYAVQDLALTESGEAAGTITTGGAAYFWHKWVLPLAALAGAIRTMNLRVRGLTV